jgi:hypothetical protein
MRRARPRTGAPSHPGCAHSAGPEATNPETGEPSDAVGLPKDVRYQFFERRTRLRCARGSKPLAIILRPVGAGHGQGLADRSVGPAAFNWPWCSRGWKPLAIDLRPVGAGNGGGGRQERRPYGARAGARIQNQFCPLIDLIAGTRNLSGNFPVDGATNSQSRRILYMRECAACRGSRAGKSGLMATNEFCRRNTPISEGSPREQRPSKT